MLLSLVSLIQLVMAIYSEIMATVAVKEIRTTSYISFDSSITQQIEHNLNVTVTGEFDMVNHCVSALG